MLLRIDSPHAVETEEIAVIIDILARRERWSLAQYRSIRLNTTIT